MAIVEMKKLTLMALLTDKDKIVNMLQTLGVLHLLEVDENDFGGLLNRLKEPDSMNLEEDLIKARRNLEFINRWSPKSPKRKGNQVVMNVNTAARFLEDRMRLVSIDETIQEIERQLSLLKVQETGLKKAMEELKDWTWLKEDLQWIKDTPNVRLSLGFIATKYIEGFAGEVNAVKEGAYLSFKDLNRENMPVLLVTHRADEEAVGSIKQRYGFSAVKFDNLCGTAADNFHRLEENLNALELSRMELYKQIEGLKEHLSYLEVLSDLLAVKWDRHLAGLHLVGSSKVFVLTAWIPEVLEQEMRNRMNDTVQSYALFFEAPKDGEVSPTLLKNHRFVRPIEFITEQYSMPSYGGVDPNWVMTPFFICFFGIMISDAIYGLIILALSFYLMKKQKPEGDFKKILGILMLGGLSASFWGILLGGWFGGTFAISALLLDPLNEPFKMIFLCLGLGVLHLYVGFGLQAYLNIKRGYWLNAFLDQGLWVLFLTALMSLALKALEPWNQYAAALLAVALILTQGRSKKNPVMKLLSGILSLYNVTGFLGDVLSYLRLFALGLTTGVIGTVINSMAFMLQGSLLGNLLMFLILLIGHSFNIGINVLGAYVHSSRLQYVEFFSKFYEGDGIKYNPFRVITRYVKLSESDGAQKIEEEAVR